ncbi:BamA/TamA family outer membrane protein [Flavobacterium sp. Sd200]|uniref:translocation and assembly module lipoprotein TamL n=1 Tax=Flavobacterium sp. Sd200 TaxID=2692211 RepID=UPI001370B2D4|nr:BamA/TamA family outer membrane protein [Flavobacterium sp. Sd200]MXN89754.1 BamA/TamA family outer membrane protein [Flavobacterium sp. Sd200]
MINKPIYYLFITALLLAYGCSNTKHLPAGEMLYIGGEVKVKDSLLSRKERKAMEKELEDLLRPKPNSSVLGLKFKLYFYNLAGEPKKEKGFRHWMRTKLGEPPVLMSQVDLDYNADILQNFSENNGYFKTRTSADSTSKAKRAKALYTVTTGKQYKIRNVTFPVDTLSTEKDSTEVNLEKAIARTKRRSLLKKGDPYSLDVIKQERERIDNRLKNRGYFYFKDDYLLMRVDSTVGSYETDIKVIIKNETPARAKKVYHIDDIIIYPNYSLSENTEKKYPRDSVQEYKDFKIIDPEHTFRPIIYDRTLFFHKGDIYSRRDHNLSLNRLVNLGTFKFVKNEFKPSDSISAKLDAYYYFTPLPRKSIRVETLAKTNSANYNGSEINVNWSNRNAFRAAELLTVSVFGGLEVQVSGQNRGYNVYRVGGETSIVWPRFISPIHIADSSAFVPRTKALVSYEYQKRMKLYALNSFRGQFGYLWKDNVREEHQLYVTDINYVSPANVTDEYNQMAENNAALQRVIDKQLIFGPSYSYTYTNTMQKRKKHTFYYKGALETSGNAVGLIMGADAKGGNPKNILGVQFSQFVKMEHDFRHYLRLNDNSQIASRIIVGVGAPYGNSGELPFIRQFFVGGTNSIRAFRARSIGPGSYRNPDIDANSFLPDQGGDIKLELNTEYRAKLFSVVHGAIFADAGNIWLWNKDEGNGTDDSGRPGAEFTGKFLNQLAVGTGAGLRFDLSFLVLRLDLAFPLRKPWLPEGERWVFDDIDFGSRAWRKENLVFNLAIGYPF